MGLEGEMNILKGRLYIYLGNLIKYVGSTVGQREYSAPEM